MGEILGKCFDVMKSDKKFLHSVGKMIEIWE